MKKVALFGDSLLKGVTLNNENRYIYTKAIDWNQLEKHLDIQIDNHSKMGATISYGFDKLKTVLAENVYDTVLIEFGGNDCDFNWSDVAKTKSKYHLPKTALAEFEKTLAHMIDYLRSQHIKPLLMTLPPIHSKNYFKWLSRNDLNQDNIMYFLEDIEIIYRHQELYNYSIIKISQALNVELIDIRYELLKHADYHRFLCLDGIHLNDLGAKTVANLFINHFTNKTEYV